MSTCAGCGAYCDGDVCDWPCEQIAFDRLKWQGKAPCDVCLDLQATDRFYEASPAETDGLCASHREEQE